MYPYTCFRGAFTPVLWALPLGFGALFGLALVGGWVGVREQQPAAFIAAFAMLYAGAVVIFFVFDRYRIPLCVVLCVFAARAIGLLLDRRISWRGVAVAGAAALVSFLPSPQSQTARARDAYCLDQVARLLESDGLNDAAKPYFEAAKRMEQP
jgi:hypothetical protein